MIIFTPLLILYLMAATTIVWVAVIDLSTIEGNPERRPVGWCLNAALARRGLTRCGPPGHGTVVVPDTLPQWLVKSVAADRATEAVTRWLTGVLVAQAPAGTMLVEWQAQLTLWPSPPPVIEVTAELEAVPHA